MSNSSRAVSPPDATVTRETETLRVTVVIPCHNAAPFLHDTIASVVAQTRPAHEIILVDDRSTDDSADIARRAGLRVLTTTTAFGVSAARNLGADAASGNALLFVDADDVIDTNMIAELAAALEQAPDVQVAFPRVRAFGEVQADWPVVLDHLHPTDMIPLLAVDCCLAVTALLRRSLFESLGGFDTSRTVSEDYDFWLRAAECGPFVQVHSTWLHYRRYSGQCSTADMSYIHTNYALRRRALVATDQRALNREAREHIMAGIDEKFMQDVQRAWFARDLRGMRKILRYRTDVTSFRLGTVAPWIARAHLPAPLLKAFDAVRGVRSPGYHW